ncbi:uncharacterized protein B0H64DRAFT_229436 [Chaetomium fimeti]|uniref:Uncharacterized protein n=1 Tax=Chaetomium fimeti TaxID=1854472 RepID=A0AAE0LPU1_9PEZI|nr:hypothetical protein B0H64DRAFT_229436 [Chaetomium fimeti]
MYIACILSYLSDKGLIESTLCFDSFPMYPPVFPCRDPFTGGRHNEPNWDEFELDRRVSGESPNKNEAKFKDDREPGGGLRGAFREFLASPRVLRRVPSAIIGSSVRIWAILGRCQEVPSRRISGNRQILKTPSRAETDCRLNGATGQRGTDRCQGRPRQGRNRNTTYLSHTRACALNIVRILVELEFWASWASLGGMAASTFWSSHRVSQHTRAHHQLTGTRYTQKVRQRQQTWRASSTNPRA